MYAVNLVGIATYYWICRKYISADRWKKTFCVIVAVHLTLFMGLRDWQTVGVDLWRYHRTYTEAKTLSLYKAIIVRGGSSLLYYLISAVCSKLGVPYELYIFCVSALFVAVSVYLIGKYSEHPLLGVFIYLGLGMFTFQFSGLKQAFAMAFLAFAYDALSQEKWKTTIAWLCAAILCHPTAIVFMPLIVGSRVKWSRKLLGVALAALVAVFLLRMPLARFISFIFSEQYVDMYKSGGGLGGTAILFIGFLAVYIFLYWNQIECLDKQQSLLLYILVFLVAIQMCSSYSYAFTRLNLYYVQFLPGVMTEILNSPRWDKLLGKWSKLAKNVFCVCLMLLMVQQYFGHVEDEKLTVYQFFWN